MNLIPIGIERNSSAFQPYRLSNHIKITQIRVRTKSGRDCKVGPTQSAGIAQSESPCCGSVHLVMTVDMDRFSLYNSLGDVLEMEYDYGLR